MSSKVLYFPYIQIPTNSWFNRTIFYWDAIGTIMPRELPSREYEINNYMKELIKYNLVNTINPESYIEDNPDFYDGFLNMINKDTTFNNMKLTDNSAIEKIFLSKGPVALEKLCELGYARKLNDYIYAVEKNISNLYMTYLALFLGIQKDIQMIPITDKIRNITSYDLPYFNRMESRRQYERDNILNNLLPSPAELIPVKEIRKFKDSNYDLLTNFRITIESEVINISKIDDAYERDIKIISFLNDIKYQKEVIYKAMKSKWKNVLFGSWFFLSGFLTGYSLTTNDLVATFQGLLNISEGLKELRNQYYRNNKLLKNPFVYLVKYEKLLKKLENK